MRYVHYTLGCNARSLSSFKFAHHFESQLTRPPPFYMHMQTRRLPMNIPLLLCYTVHLLYSQSIRLRITRLVVVMEWWENCLNMVDREWQTCLSSYIQLYGRSILFPGNGERSLLLIFFRKGIGRILVTTGVSLYSKL